MAHRSQIAEHLKQILKGSVYTDPDTLDRHSTDMSIYRIRPMAVVVPRTMDDLCNLVGFCAREGIPITARGGGSGTAGSALGRGIVVVYDDNSFLQDIGEISDFNGRPCVTVDAGVRHQDLQLFLRKRGYYLPADPSSGPICNIGGNIATKASGPHGLSHGAIDRYLEHLEFVSAKGELINTQTPQTIPDTFTAGVGRLADSLKKSENAFSFLSRRKAMKTASGYNLFPLIDEQISPTTLARIFAGSIGTLGLVTRAVLGIEPYLAEKSTLLLFFNTLAELSKATAIARRTKATAIELISRDTIRILKSRRAQKIPFDDFHLLFIEFEGEERISRIDALLSKLDQQHLVFGDAPQRTSSTQEAERIMAIRKQILPVLMRPGPNLRALSIVNDVGVLPEYLPGFIQELEQFFKKLELETIIFGHAGNGNLHLRPLIDITAPQLEQRIQTIADGVYDIVFRYHGTITAEHGMGRLRAPYLEREWGQELYAAMKQVKMIFDPEDLFNPDSMFSTDRITDHIRLDFST